tara:strand:- start:2587 stop:2691 length:105 start_codon:yes stop_codon:yes gene_type:complete
MVNLGTLEWVAILLIVGIVAAIIGLAIFLLIIKK